MPQHPQTRALQHLLIQGFTLYTDEAATAMRAQGGSSLDNPNHAHAIVMRGGVVQCFWGGMQLMVPLEVNEVRDARLKLETAVTLQLAPPTEKLEAFPDEMLRRELKRRKLDDVIPD